MSDTTAAYCLYSMSETVFVKTEWFNCTSKKIVWVPNILVSILDDDPDSGRNMSVKE